MSEPLVSIIIPTFNRAHLIGETLDSIIAQTYTNWECIIVDDGSTDNTEKVLSTYEQKDNRFQFFKRPIEKLKGANSCRNYGAQVSKGEYIIFLDSDDYLENFCIEKRVEKISGIDYLTFAVFPMMIKSPTGEILEKKIPPKESYLDDFLSEKLLWGIMCPIWNKDFFLSLDGFNERYPRLNDPDLHIRAMIKDNDNFYVFRENTPDSVYVKSNNHNSVHFPEKVFQSLILFIPDITKILKATNNSMKLPLLKGYLVMWLRSFMKHSSSVKTIELIDTFYKNNVITKQKQLVLKLNVFIYYSLVKVSELHKKFIYKKVI